MRPKHRVRAAPPLLGEIGVEKKKVCPVCKKEVTVGGPHNGQWIFQTHSPNNAVTVICEGTGQRVQASPSG